GFASPHYGFMLRYSFPGGLPHSDIHGSKPARGSPWLFAACDVLHRLLVPRHPPNALLLLEITGSAPKGRSDPPCTGTIHRRMTSSASQATQHIHMSPLNAFAGSLAVRTAGQTLRPWRAQRRTRT